MEFYRCRAADQPPGTVVIVAEDTVASILLAYLPNTGAWHRANELSNDYLFGDEGGTYEPITPAQAAALLPHATGLDETHSLARRMLARYRAQLPTDRRSNAQMGLPTPA